MTTRLAPCPEPHAYEAGYRDGADLCVDGPISTASPWYVLGFVIARGAHFTDQMPIEEQRRRWALVESLMRLSDPDDRGKPIIL